MSTVLKMNELNQLKKGDKLPCPGVIVRGTVQMQRGKIIKTVQGGSMVGIFDLFAEEYPTKWIVAEDTFFYAFMIKDETSLEAFFQSNPDYRGIAVYSLAKELEVFFEERKRILQAAFEIESLFKMDMEGFLEDIAKLNCSEEKMSNYLDYANISLDNHKKYYYNSVKMAVYQVKEISLILKEVLRSSQEIQKYLEENYSRMAGEALLKQNTPWDCTYVRNQFLILLQKQKEAKKKQKEDDIPVENLMEL